jgi:hypothetical protein
LLFNVSVPNIVSPFRRVPIDDKQKVVHETYEDNSKAFEHRDIALPVILYTEHLEKQSMRQLLLLDYKILIIIDNFNAILLNLIFYMHDYKKREIM